MPVSGAVYVNPLANLILKNCTVGKPLLMMTGLYHLSYRYFISFQLYDFQAVNFRPWLSPTGYFFVDNNSLQTLDVCISLLIRVL